MVKRVVDTDFWTDMDVIDFYSPEDKYFYLYLITNGKSSQVGIYSLPIKVISFETGYSAEAVQVLLERFSEKYKQIIYSKETQEVTILNSLRFSILKGGKPVKDLLEKELGLVKDGSLIQATYENMVDFWELSKRPFDKTIKATFETELKNRRLMNAGENYLESVEPIHNVSKNVTNNVNNNDSNNDSNNDNNNEESGTTNRGLLNLDEILKKNLSEEVSNDSESTNHEAPDENEVLEHYANIIKKYNPTLESKVNAKNIVKLYYQEVFGEVHQYVEAQFKDWLKFVPTSLILEALSRSVRAARPLPYANTIIENWLALGVTSREEVLKIDEEFQGDTF